MNKKEKIAPFTEFYKQVVFAEKAFDVNYKEISKVLFNEIDRLNSIIDKAIEYMQDYCEIVVPDANIKSLILKEEYKKIIEMLGGEDN